MRIILVRHYKTVSNQSDLIIGWGESPPVKGWQHDMEYVDKILHSADLDFEAVYTSKLRRARNTGQFYAQKRGINGVIDCAALNEVNYGKLNQKSKKWVAEHIHEYKQNPDFVFPDGESFRQMQQRSVEFIESLTKSRRDKTILMVAHSGVIRALICHFLDLDYAANLKRRITHRYVGDFTFDGPVCVHYAELGTPSGFDQGDIIQLPYYREAPRRLSGNGNLSKSKAN